jgi:ribosomal protein S18 acetylase RimI-like enzyme
MPDCELSFFGLVPSEVGNGTGRVLIDEAIRRAFEKPISRFWLSTCTLDHPKALSFYKKAGFIPYARFVEVHDDPRLQGKLPLDAAPQIPLLPEKRARDFRRGPSKFRMNSAFGFVAN